MLFHLLYGLHTSPHFSWLNVVRYTSTRIILATLTALALSLLLSPWFIRRLKEQQIGQVVRADGPATHLKKSGTPTMGGTLILFCLAVPTLLWCDLTNRFVWLALSVTVGYGVVGFLDDYLKLVRRDPKGLAPRWKLLGQVTIGFAAVLYLFGSDMMAGSCTLEPGTSPWQRLAFCTSKLALPLADYARFAPALPLWAYVLFALFVVVAFSNAVNLTDGLDGLAIGPVIISSATFLVLAYGAGQRLAGFTIAEYLRIPHVPGAGELAIFCGAMAGAGVGFLWFNTHPAQVFMGDVGALALGGALGMVAVMTKNEFTLVIIGGIFVLEAISVVVQVASFRLTGKRVFLMAPIHHHFEKKWWEEEKVTVRFWIISFMLALVALATLKVR